MKTRLLAFVFILATVMTAVAVENGDLLPKQFQRFEIPLPQSQVLRLRLVEVSPDANLFASQDFSIGSTIKTDDATGGYTNRLTTTSVSGSVYLSAELTGGKTGWWVIPMGETEVSRAQYAAVMGLPMPNKDEGELPQTSLTTNEVQVFCDRLNAYLASDPKAKKLMVQLAASKKHGIPFARLPMENEWEFAARGGKCVDEQSFSEAHPEYMEMENLGGSTAKLNRVGRSGAVNACGIHDMLGNVQELVQGGFCPEYNYGRVGGLSVRGGSYVTPPREVFTYTRREISPYGEDGQPYRSNQVGFRLVLGSTIGSGAQIKSEDLNEAWKDYWKTRVAHRPGEVATDSLNTKLEAERDDLRKQLVAMREDFKKLNASGIAEAGKKDELLNAMNNRVAEMTERLQQMENRVSRSQAVQAQAAMLMIYYASHNAVLNGKKLSRMQNYLKLLQEESEAGLEEDRAKVQEAKDTVQALQANVLTYWEQYSRGCEALKEVDEAVVIREEQKRMAEIQRKAKEDAAVKGQEKVFNVAMKHYRLYQNSGRLTSEAREAWCKELSHLQ